MIPFLELFLEAAGTLFAIVVGWALLRQAAFNFRRKKWANEIRPKGDTWSI